MKAVSPPLWNFKLHLSLTGWVQFTCTCHTKLKTFERKWQNETAPEATIFTHYLPIPHKLGLYRFTTHRRRVQTRDSNIFFLREHTSVWAGRVPFQTGAPMCSTPFLVMKENNCMRRSPQNSSTGRGCSGSWASGLKKETHRPSRSGRRQMTTCGQCLGKPDHLQPFLNLNTVDILGSDNSLLFMAVLCPVRHFITSLASAPWMSVSVPLPLLR